MVSYSKGGVNNFYNDPTQNTGSFLRTPDGRLIANPAEHFGAGGMGVGNLASLSAQHH